MCSSWLLYTSFLCPVYCGLPWYDNIITSYSILVSCYTDIGIYYVGTLSTTENGKTCQRWDSQTPHSHSWTDESRYPDITVSDASNYCRNPEHWGGGLWCWTTDPNVNWERCSVPTCQPAGNATFDISAVILYEVIVDICTEQLSRYHSLFTFYCFVYIRVLRFWDCVESHSWISQSLNTDTRYLKPGYFEISSLSKQHAILYSGTPPTV